MCASFKVFFSVLTEIFDLEEIHNDTGAGYGLFPTPNSTSREIGKSLRLGKNSIILPYSSIFSPRELGIF